MKRTRLEEEECPVARALDAIGDWWSLLIIRDAFDGMTRFGQFQKSLDISRGILATRLKHLVSVGVLATTPVGGFKEYRLTEKGRKLFLVVVSLRQWGEDHCFRKGEKRSALVETGSGRPIRRLELHAHDGDVLAPDATTVRKVAE
ncbi:winged helix-turn-helix transcriptional regulator [Chelatococcus reniformis]|uniref:Transcriptional regulator, HxlR family protein n=1 Tax=Chelatococcus reniformis TaxID=1494448 RepID=A0A916UML0_9HYPH|nr:helix-turn-helix domain-containing protein [Chelatococcus reniformis]GGC77758.1 transcriptional regulator, HxlR family protein [Chelatococcus reniformis]